MKAKLSQEKLAEAAGVSVEAISNIERAKSIPSLELFLALSRELGLDINEFMHVKKMNVPLSTARIAAESQAIALAAELNDADLARWLRLGRALPEPGKPAGSSE